MNNPPAFPYEERTTQGSRNHFGMTLRDYFAAKAMHVLLSTPEFHEETDDTIATASYHIADAMLEAREQ